MTKPTYEQLEARLEMVGELASVSEKLLEALAAENAVLAAENKKAVDAVTVFSNVTHDITEIICDELGHDRVAEIVAAYNDLGNMPATDRIVAGIKADGASEFISRLQQCVDEGDFVGDEVAVIVGAIDCGKEFCEQLREGAK